MRCPKCHYISFDHLEKCRKCKKNIMNVAMELNGTMYDMIPPSFLKIDIDDAPDAESGWAEGAGNEIMDALESETSLFADEAFSYPEGTTDAVDKENVEEGGQEEPPRASESSPPAMNFGDLDISDLAPPESGAGLSLGKELALAAADAPSRETGAAQGASDKQTKSFGLADLQLEGLDLDISSRPKVTNVAGARNLTDVKTGTALDRFDINLDDLFDDPKDKK